MLIVYLVFTSLMVLIIMLAFSLSSNERDKEDIQEYRDIQKERLIRAKAYIKARNNICKL